MYYVYLDMNFPKIFISYAKLNVDALTEIMHTDNLISAKIFCLGIVFGNNLGTGEDGFKLKNEREEFTFI